MDKSHMPLPPRPVPEEKSPTVKSSASLPHMVEEKPLMDKAVHEVSPAGKPDRPVNSCLGDELCTFLSIPH